MTSLTSLLRIAGNYAAKFRAPSARQAQVVEIGRKGPVLAKRLLGEVGYHAEEMYRHGDDRDVTGVIAKRLGVGRALVDRARTALMLYHQRRAAALLVGHKAAVEMARDAGAGVLEEL